MRMTTHCLSKGAKCSSLLRPQWDPLSPRLSQSLRFSLGQSRLDLSPLPRLSPDSAAKC